jgi:threonine/homoserine/homoserine lactone efflux protein
MPKLLRIFVTGMIISFLGSLPLGTLNVAAMQISIYQGLLQAFLFSSGSLAAEVVYVRLSLIAMDWIRKQQKIFKALEWVTLVIVLALAVSSFYAAMHPTVEDSPVWNTKLPMFFFGFLMSLVNPVQIPFWFGWSTVLFTKKILLPKNTHYNMYIFGIGMGTLMGNFVFIFGGQLIADKITNNQHILNYIIGGIFALTALIQVWKMVSKKDVRHQMEHPEELTKKFEVKLENIEEKMDELEEKLEKDKSNH